MLIQNYGSLQHLQSTQLLKNLNCKDCQRLNLVRYIIDLVYAVDFVDPVDCIDFVDSRPCRCRWSRWLCWPCWLCRPHWLGRPYRLGRQGQRLVMLTMILTSIIESYFAIEKRQRLQMWNNCYRNWCFQDCEMEKSYIWNYKRCDKTNIIWRYRNFWTFGYNSQKIEQVFIRKYTINNWSRTIWLCFKRLDIVVYITNAKE